MLADVLIDGGAGEGGGQVLRTALALSLLTGRGFRLFNVRANRPKPGLAAQHLASVEAAAAVGQASVRGNKLGSREVIFPPGPVQGGHYDFRIGTAGATALVLHTISLPLLLRASQPSTIRILGGTHVKAAPCFEYLHHTWAGYLAQLGGRVMVKLECRGFFPIGQGGISATIEPCPGLRGFQPTQSSEAPDPPLVRCFSFATGNPKVCREPAELAREQALAFTAVLEKQGFSVQSEVKEDKSQRVGTYVGGLLPTSPVPTFHFCVGERGKRAQVVGETAAAQLLHHWQASPCAVDAHAADQLLLPLVFAEGPSRFATAEVTSHLLTNAATISRFVDRPIHMVGNRGEPGTVEIAG